MSTGCVQEKDFTSRRTELTDDTRFLKQVKEIRKILELDCSITDKEIIGDLFQHILKKKVNLSSEERIIEAVNVIQKLSVESALEGEQKADNIVEDVNCREY